MPKVSSVGQRALKPLWPFVPPQGNVPVVPVQLLPLLLGSRHQPLVGCSCGRVVGDGVDGLGSWHGRGGQTHICWDKMVSVCVLMAGKRTEVAF